jgi:hypothetical protein
MKKAAYFLGNVIGIAMLVFVVWLVLRVGWLVLQTMPGFLHDLWHFLVCWN